MKVLQSRLFSHIPDIRHGTATLAFQPLTFRGHPVRAVRNARARFLATLGIPPSALVVARQVHGNRVRIIADAERDRAAKGKYSIPATDALLTQRPAIAIGVFTADCIPVLLHDPETGWIGAVHAGWRGIAKGVIPKTLTTLRKRGVRMSSLRVWLGPAICVKCYTTKSRARVNILSAIAPNTVIRKAGQYHVDIAAAVQRQLQDFGILRTHVEQSRTCTQTSTHLPSARRQGKDHPNTLTVMYRTPDARDLRGKRVVVFGLGILGGGVASARFAVAQNAEVHVVDALPAKKLATSIATLRGLPITYHCGYSAQRALPQADVVIVNPGIAPTHPALRNAQKAGARVTNDLSLFRERSQNPVLAITGTKGKTTVTFWLAHILAKQKPIVAGNVQHSPLSEPQAMHGKRPVVLEVSSYQLEHCDVPLAPHLSVVTNLYPDHLNRHGTMRNYAKVKAALLSQARGPIVLPYDSAWRKYAPKVRTRFPVYWAAEREHRNVHAWIASGWITVRLGARAQRILHVRHLKQSDLATQRNAVTVALAARAYGVPIATLRQGLRSFPGVAQRFETVRTYKHRTFINATTATNPVAALTAVRSVAGPCIVLAGGSSKALPMRAFAKELRAKKAKVILFAGSASTELLAHLGSQAFVVRSMAHAVRSAWKLSHPGDTIILAPGAASFGMFRNEFDRGAQFVRSVHALQ